MIEPPSALVSRPAPFWTKSQVCHWEKLCQHRFVGDPPSGSEASSPTPSILLSMRRRMQVEYGWSEAFTEQAVEEYRRFCFLSTLQPVTPSDVVDMVWHMHLLYTENYWNVWCSLLGKPLHHGPTQGGAQEDRRFYDQYAQTLLLYQKVFGPLNETIWPPASKRFQALSRFRLVPVQHFWVLPRPWAFFRHHTQILFRPFKRLLGRFGEFL